MLKAKELGLELDGPQLNDVVDMLKRLEHEGYHFESADASLELLMRHATGWRAAVVPRRVVPGDHRRRSPDADTPVRRPPRRRSRCTSTARPHATAEGNGPVNALDQALRKAIGSPYPRSATCTSPTTRCGCSTRTRAPGRHPGADRQHRRRADAGPRSGWGRTSSRRRGRRSRTRSCTACSAPRARLATTPVPTDPFVPERLEDEPRQLPNLPPGVKVPPAKSWMADRPGDLPRASPRASSSARPGPTSATRSRSRSG